MSSSSRLWLALGLALIPVGLLAGRATSQNVKRNSPSSVQEGNVTIKNAPQGTATWDDAQGLARLTKDVVIWQTGEDFILYAQDVTYSRPKNQAVARGKLRVETRDSTLKGDLITGYFDDKKLTLTGNVVITSHGQKDGIVTKENQKPAGFKGELNNQPLKITCDRVEWDYETKQARITGNIHIYQGNSVGTCALIIYDEPRNVAQLKGNVRFGDEKKRVFLGDNILVFINTGQVQSDDPIRVLIPKGSESDGPAPTPRPTRAPEAFKPPRRIDPSVFAEAGLTPPAAPTPTPPPADGKDDPPPPPADEN